MAEKNNSSSLAEKASAVPLGGQESARRWRTRWLVGVVIGALLAACGVFYEADEHDGFAQLYADVLHGGVRGPYGTFPTSPPVRPSLKSLRTVVGTVSVSSLVYGGISISSTSDNVVVNAVDIRSGKTYWRYRRHHLENSSTALDKKRGELFAAWGPPWPASGKTSIEMMDVRSGRVRWRRSTGLTSVWSAKDQRAVSRVWPWMMPGAWLCSATVEWLVSTAAPAGCDGRPCGLQVASRRKTPSW